MADVLRPPRNTLADVLFVLFLVVYAVISVSAIPYDFTDLCYLFSLEQGRWVPQEWVHPIYVPVLDVYRQVIGVFGYHGPMLVPIELLNVVAAVAAFALLYREARRFPGASLAAVLTISIAALCPGFWWAAVRPTPYALALLTQVVSLLLLVSAHPGRSYRYALAGAFAGLTTGLHASAMALAPVAVLYVLLEPGPARPRRVTLMRILAFGGSMLAVVIACWGMFIVYRSIGVRFLRNQDFASLFASVEQVPGTSIYSSHSAAAQVTSFVGTISNQSRALLGWPILFFALALLRRWYSGPPLLPLERRWLIAAGANFTGIAGFFVINNTHNGFIFASLTLLPVVSALALRYSPVLLALLAVLTVPDVGRSVVTSYRQGDRDPLLAEVRFLHGWLGRRDVLLTPGSPFAEMLYLAHLNLFEVSLDKPTHPSPEVPVLHPGAELQARVAWWRAHGGRVFYALGDESTRFTDDVPGAEKRVQIFWRPEAEAPARAQQLAEVRAELEGSGLVLRDAATSPGGQRYAEIDLPPSSPIGVDGPAAFLSVEELRAIVASEDSDLAPYHVYRTQYLADLEAAIPGDPWRACDVMELVCEGLPDRDGAPLSCRRLPGCDDHSGRPRENTLNQSGPSQARQPQTCFWGPTTDREAVETYLAQWMERSGLGRLTDWGFHADGQDGELTLAAPDGKLALRWRLSDSCDAGAVDVQASGGISSAAVSVSRVQDLVAGLPVPKVRAAGKPHGT
jgi:hypothetical protein